MASRINSVRVNENVVYLTVWALGCVLAFGAFVAGYAVYYAIVG